MGFDFDGLAQKNEQTRQQTFFYSAFSAMGFIAKAKGRVTEHEINFATSYMNTLGLNAQMRSEAQEAFRDGKNPGFPLESTLKKLKRSCMNRQDLLLVFMEIQIQVAFADGALDPAEREALHKIASLLGFSSRDLDRLLEMIMAGAQFHHGAQNAPSSKQQLAHAYKILGVDESISNQELKKAYRKLMSQHHPDKLVAKGLPPEMMESAKQKAQDIQSAYELIQKERK